MLVYRTIPSKFVLLIATKSSISAAYDFSEFFYSPTYGIFKGMKTAFVTGGTGFVGFHVARRLIEQGYQVRALARPTSRLENLDALKVQIAVGDLQNIDSLRAAVKGCQTVFHVAADYRLWARDPNELYRSNVDGTLNLLRAASEAGVERIVYTSSVGVLGYSKDGTPGNEQTPVSLADMIGHYKRSKFLAEEKAREFCSEQRLPIVIVNPSTPIGENDIKPTPTGKIILDFLKGRMPAFVDTGLNLVDVHDVAKGHLLALERGKSGERYILGHQNITLQEMLRQLAEITGRKAPTWRIPYRLAYAAAWIDTFIWGRLLRREPHIPLEAVRMASKHMYFDASRAVRELGLPQSPIRGALERAVAWFRNNRYAT
jgi:dihydroflavonol-4-reductase